MTAKTIERFVEHVEGVPAHRLHAAPTTFPDGCRIDQAGAFIPALPVVAETTVTTEVIETIAEDDE